MLIKKQLACFQSTQIDELGYNEDIINEICK